MSDSVEGRLPGGPPSTRKIRRVEALVAVVVVQLGWCANVLGVSHELAFFGPVVVLVLATLHCAYSITWRDDLKLMLGLAVVGTALDSVQSVLGFLIFYGRPEGWPSWLAPPWITALWFHFGTLRWPFFRPMSHKPWLAALCGVVGAPLAYWGGTKLQAAAFGPSPWLSALSLAVIWAVLLPVAARVTWRKYL